MSGRKKPVALRGHVAPAKLDTTKGISKQTLARSTTAAKKSGTPYFMEFIALTFGVESIEEVNDEAINADFFDLYCSWLVGNCKKKSSNQQDVDLKQGTILQYLSAAKSAIMERKPRLDLWKEERWYATLRSSIESYTARAAIAKGEAIADKAEPVGRRLLLKICEYFAKCENESAVAKRIGIIANRMACGRSGELANCTWQLSRWDEENQCLEWLWSDQKNTKQKIVPHPPDYDSYYCDFYHAMGEYLMIRNVPNENARDWVFSGLFNVINVSQVRN